MHLVFTTPFEVWIVLLLAVAAVVASLYTYRWLRPVLPPSRWFLLLVLRLCAIAIAALLLMRPVVSVTDTTTHKPVVLFLLDSSASMSVSDLPGGESRWQASVTELTGWLSGLQAVARPEVAVFDETARFLQSPTALEASEPNGVATSLVAALQAASRVENVHACVLISDGQHNAAGDPVQIAEQLGTVVHTVGVGTLSGEHGGLRDIVVAGLALPDELPLNNQVSARVLVDAVGCAGLVVPVLLMEDGNTVAQAELTLDSEKGPQELRLSFVPDREGLHTYTVEVPPRSFERVPQNNRRTVMARVSARHIRVFYVEGTLRAEYGAIVEQFLARDPDIQFLAMVQIRPNVFLKRTNMEGFAELRSLPNTPDFWEGFDVVIIGDLDASYWKEDVLEALRRRVEEGAGLLLLGGYHALGPGGYGETPIAAILPVDLGGRNIGQIEDEFQPVLTVAGEGHDIMQGIQGFFPRDDRPAVQPLPPLRGATRVRSPSPAALVLLEYHGPDGSAMPVLAVRTAGKGRTAVFAADTTRLWYQATKALGRESPFVKFWGQLVRWLAGRPAATVSLSLTARTNKPWYRPGEPVEVVAEVRDAEGAGTNAATVQVTIKSEEDEQTYPLQPLGDPPGRYVVQIPSPRAGRYTAVVTGTLDDHEFEPVELQFEIGRPNLEFDDVSLNADLLKRIAAATGGQYVPLELAPRVLEELNLQLRERVVVREIQIAWPPGCWVLFVSALGVEWYLRRKWRLR